MKPDRGALIKGSDPLPGHRVHTTAGDTWRPPARRLIITKMVIGVWKTDDKDKDFFSPSLGEERTTPWATSLAP